MTAASFSAPFRRLVALLLVPLTLLVLYTGILRPYADRLAALDGAVAEASDRLALYERLAVRRPEIEARLAAWSVERGGGLLTAESEALAAADLQQMVQQVIAATGGRLLSIRVEPAVEQAPVQRIGLQVNAGLRLDQLLAVLHALEGGGTVLVIDRLTVRSQQAVLRLPQPGGDAVAANLSVTFGVTGFRRAEGS